MLASRDLLVEIRDRAGNPSPPTFGRSDIRPVRPCHTSRIQSDALLTSCKSEDGDILFGVSPQKKPCRGEFSLDKAPAGWRGGEEEPKGGIWRGGAGRVRYMTVADCV